MRTPTPLAVALVALLAIASLPACDKARQVPGTTGTASGCTGCHGDQANAAPPVATAGASTGVKVGAHQAHLVKTNLRAAALACADCHTVPTTIAHSNGTVDLTWGALARDRRPHPHAGQPDRRRPGHLGGLAHLHQLLPRRRLRRRRSPGTATTPELDRRGRRHRLRLLPPGPAGHRRPHLGDRPPPTAAAATPATPAPPPTWPPAPSTRPTHLNGTVDTPTLTCTTCHGSAANAAPPVATPAPRPASRSAPTRPTS